MPASPPDDLQELARTITGCRACPRLVEWRETAAGRARQLAHRGQEYWAKPVPGFGDPAARIWIVGLAPAADGANRTGRMFTGDRSGEWLYAALFRAGLANQPTAVSRDDGLALHGAWISSAVRCAPPANQPTREERRTCAPYLVDEARLLTEVRVVVALGALGWEEAWGVLAAGARPRPKFGHLAEATLPDGRTLLGSFHPSQQNTFTGKLTVPLFDAVWARAKALAA